MAGFPSDPSKIEVGFAYGADLSADPASLTYSAVTSDVEPEVKISRGRIRDSVTAQPNQIDMSVKDPNGAYSPRNIAGPNYGRLRRNTPVRARVDTGSGFVTRGIANLPDWNPTWIGPNMGDRIALQALGPLGRLGQRSDPLQPALQRTVLVNSPLGYWPCDDGAQVVGAAPAAGGGTLFAVPNPVTGAFTPPGFAQGNLGSWFNPGVSLASGGFLEGKAAAGGATQWAFDFVINMGTVRPVGQDVTTHLFVTGNGDPSAVSLDWDVDVGPQGSILSADTVELALFLDGPGLASSNSTLATIHGTIWDGQPHFIRFTVAQSGANINWQLFLDNQSSASGTVLTQTLQAPTLVSLNAALYSVYSTWAMGHVTQWNTATPPISAATGALATAGYAGELAATRFARVCAEQGILSDVTASRSQPMGPQPLAAILGVLRECEAADAATMVDRIAGKLGFNPKDTRYNQSATLTADYTTQVQGLTPLDDDRNLVNDVTVARTGGASVRYKLASGPLSVDPVTGSGPYPITPPINFQTDNQSVNMAHWLVMKGTVDEPRYVLTINLRAQPNLIASWLNCDIGSRILVNGPPSIHTGPAPLDLVIEGYEELIDAVRWEATLYCRPERPYEVYQVQNGAGNRSHMPSDGGCTVNVQRAPTDTSFAVTSTGTPWIDSATYPSQFPFNVICAGEVMTCTAVTGTGASQTMTMTRGLHGVTKTIPANSVVQLWRAPVTAL